MSDLTTSEYLNVPGNIKQFFLPYVLDSNNGIHTNIILSEYNKSSTAVDSTVKYAKGATTQYFSFRPGNGTDGVSYTDIGEAAASNASGFLKILPAAFYRNAFTDTNNDIANLLGYSNLKTSITGKDLLRSIPYISVREYLQDAKLNQMMNILGAISEAFLNGVEFAKETEGLGFLKTADVLWEGIKKFINPETLEDIMSEAVAKLGSSVKMNTYYNDKYDKFVLDFPYAVYYRLISTTSLNVYELPYNGKILWETSGGGWSNGIFGGLEAGKESIIGQFINYIGKNIKINTSPTWDGPNDLPIKVEIDFSLYNDTIDAAVKNYIFLTTFLANNKWMQYHMFLHSPCLYDVKIPGVNRLYMCQANAKVEQKGVLRNPSVYGLTTKTFNDVISILSSKRNSSLTVDDSKMRESDMIRIPDVYDVHITFTSLLPNNFNNHMFLFYNNDRIIPLKDENIHLTGFYNTMWKSVLDNTSQMFKDALNSAKDALNSAKSALTNKKSQENYLSDK